MTTFIPDTKAHALSGWSGRNGFGDNGDDGGRDEGLAEPTDRVGKARSAGEQGALSWLRNRLHR
ncbi:MAG: hypothetical protein KJ072_14675 [Verrucomicrobia bacterium]|nr:hypothetical protein [Verrucomicrobiota bacterium]